MIPLIIGLALQVSVVAQQPSSASRTATPVPDTYRVVLKDGTQYVTREPYRVQGKLALFTLSSGHLVSVPLESVDQEMTRAANLQLRRPASTPTVRRRSPIRITLVGTPGPTVPPPQGPGDSSTGDLRFSGSGAEATNLFDLTQGLYIFRLHHVGKSNFIVHLMAESGPAMSSLVNVIGVFDGSKAVRIERSGRYLLNIDADGNWSISVAKPDSDSLGRSPSVDAPTPPRIVKIPKPCPIPASIGEIGTYLSALDRGSSQFIDELTALIETPNGARDEVALGTFLRVEQAMRKTAVPPSLSEGHQEFLASLDGAQRAVGIGAGNVSARVAMFKQVLVHLQWAQKALLRVAAERPAGDSLGEAIRCIAGGRGASAPGR